MVVDGESINKIHLQPACNDSIATLSIIMDLLTRNESLGRQINSFKLLSRAPIEIMWAAYPAPVIALYHPTEPAKPTF